MVLRLTTVAVSKNLWNCPFQMVFFAQDCGQRKTRSRSVKAPVCFHHSCLTAGAKNWIGKSQTQALKSRNPGDKAHFLTKLINLIICEIGQLLKWWGPQKSSQTLLGYSLWRLGTNILWTGPKYQNFKFCAEITAILIIPSNKFSWSSSVEVVPSYTILTEYFYGITYTKS